MISFTFAVLLGFVNLSAATLTSYDRKKQGAERTGIYILDMGIYLATLICVCLYMAYHMTTAGADVYKCLLPASLGIYFYFSDMPVAVFRHTGNLGQYFINLFGLGYLAFAALNMIG